MLQYRTQKLRAVLDPPHPPFAQKNKGDESSSIHVFTSSVPWHEHEEINTNGNFIQNILKTLYCTLMYRPCFTLGLWVATEEKYGKK
jgi:hypothetical protein